MSLSKLNCCKNNIYIDTIIIYEIMMNFVTILKDIF